MLFLFDLLLSAILEGPLDDVSLMGDSLDVMALSQLCPEVMEFLKLDQMPDFGERSGNDRGLRDGG